MTDLSSIQMAVLQILSWQTPGYLCSSNSSAFISEGLEDVEALDKALISLQADGYVEFYTETANVDIIKVERDSNGEPIIDLENNTVKPILNKDGDVQLETITRFLDSGWLITEKGRSVVSS